MVKRIIQLFHKQFHNMNQAALVLAGFTLFVQIAGLVRDRLLAGRIGPGAELDVYNAAFLIPDLIFALGASLVSVTILMPFLSERAMDESKGGVHTFLNNIFTTFFGAMILVSIAMYIAMPWLVPYIAPGFDAETLHTLIGVSRIMLLSPILLGLSNLLGTITQLHKKFFVYALSPVLYNIGIIVGIIFFYPRMGVRGLALGVVVGALLHLVVQIPVIVRQQMIPRFVTNIDWRDIWHVVRISIPRTLTLSFNQMGLMAIYALASQMSAGTISVFKFSLTLQSVPIAIIGISYSVAAFPTLVEHFARGAHEEFIQAIIKPMRQIIFWSVPVIVLFVVLRAQIVRVILGTGNFDWVHTRLVAASLAILVVGVLAQSLMYLLVRAYYAAGKTWRPLLINGLSTVFMICMAFVFVHIFTHNQQVQILLEKILRVQNVGGAEVVALSLAYTLGIIINYLILWIFFRIEFLSGRVRIFSETILHIIVASLLMGVTSYYALDLFNKIFNLNTFWGVLGQGFCAGVMGILLALSFLLIIKNTEVLRLREYLFKKKR